MNASAFCERVCSAEGDPEAWSAVDEGVSAAEAGRTPIQITRKVKTGKTEILRMVHHPCFQVSKMLSLRISEVNEKVCPGKQKKAV
jgi:predicted phosphohydrolase